MATQDDYLQSEQDAEISYELNEMQQIKDREDFDAEWNKRNNEYSEWYSYTMFPQGLMSDGLEDYVNFYFLDIVQTDENGNPTGWHNTTYNRATIDNVSKRIPEMVGSQGKVVREVISAGTTAGAAIGSVVTTTVKKVQDPNGTDISQTYDKYREQFKAGLEKEFQIKAEYRQTGQVVSLLMPETVQYNYGAGWQTVDSSPTGIGLLLDIALGDAKFTDRMAYEVNKMVHSIITENGGAAASAYAGKTTNPYTSQAFEAMSRRQFRFDWNLIPKNKMELDAINKIIKRFRFHIHPTLDSSNAFLLYPSQVDVIFYTRGGENKWLPKIATCIIKDFSVNYTPNNQWSTVKTNEDEGAPSQFQISLTVEEIVPLVKTDIENGF